MQNALRCGTSGWSHPDWNSVVYPALKPRGFHPLEYLSQHVDMVEIDASFDQPFDTVVSLETLEHLPHPVAFLRRMHSVLAPGADALGGSDSRRHR